MAWGGLPLNITKLLEFTAEAVYDPTGTDYLYSRYTVTVEALLARFGDGYIVAINGEQGPIPQFISGRAAVRQGGIKSVADVRHALAQRSPFAIWTRNSVTGQPDILLASDAPDCQNGPTPLQPASVTQVYGDGNSVFVQFQFAVCIRECPIAVVAIAPQLATREIRRSGTDPKGGAVGGEAGVHSQRLHAFDNTPFAAPRGRLQLLSINGRAPVLLSHRFTTRLSVDSTDESPAYTVSGTAIFNRQGLAALPVAGVEQFASSLFFPLPPNCRREGVDVATSPDGLALEYTYTDKELVRGYVDIRCKLSNGRVQLVAPGAAPRMVAGVSLVSKREYTQPAVASGAFEFFDFLSTANFANEADSGPEESVPVVGKILGVGKEQLRRFTNTAIAGARTINAVLPTLTEFAAAEVRGTREARMADLQSLAIALCAGALGQGNDPNPKPERTGQLAKFALLPPASQFSIEADHTSAVVRCSLMVQRSGLADFLIGDTQSAVNRMLLPLPDDIVGGRCTIGIFNILDALGVLPSLSALGGLIGTPVGVTKLVDGTVVNKYADELLVTAADCLLRAPAGDGVYRPLSANLLRVAANLLKPCEQPSSPRNGYLALPEPQQAVNSPSTPTPPPKAQTPPDPKAVSEAFRKAWNENAKLVIGTQ